ncbi:hypothetical protein B0T25DRAFT_594217 [Lasiosphaeria hispida]|uniref:Uncharacterized protein n=1 Tax=Lasiosphaeria hispida TaxID=260671 RepID=A0AAJ0H6Y4_9PEZI|nr:hypothetical protein B0T25DRAFT_594217 [Lasiosphaeria hispida]
MAPIRRYLRITKYSVLEVRIYLDNPALAQTWLLNPRDPVLPRVIERVRPLVLPKLREEQERQRSRKKSKKRSIKDVVIEDDFEVSIFLTETDTRHSLLHKQKHFRDKTQTKLTSNSSKLTGESRDAPIDVDGALSREVADVGDEPIIREEDEDQDPIDLDDIPDVHETAASPGSSNRRPKRRRERLSGPEGQGSGEEMDKSSADDDDDIDIDVEDVDSDSSANDLFVGDSDGSDAGMGPPPPKRRKDKDGEGGDDKKKLAMDISYEGFAIYGRVLCLVVKRRDGASRAGTFAVPSSKSQTGRPGGQAVMENWITSTQLPEAGVTEDDVL